MKPLLAVSFHCTGVSKSRKQDQKKLKRMLKYISSINLEHTIRADDLDRLSLELGQR